MPLFRALRHALRALLRAPAFSAIVIIILALGIAANTTIFTLVDELLLNPFPYRDPGRLVMIWESNAARGGIAAKRVATAWPNFDVWRAENHSFERMEAMQILLGFNLTGLKTPEHLIAAKATPGFFPMLGVNAVLGRTFLPGEDTPGANSTVVLTYSFWKKHFGGISPLGQKLLLDGVPYSIVGVLPKDFHLPAIFEGISEYKPDIWVALPTVSTSDPPRVIKWRHLVACARLKPGVSLLQARADMTAIAERRAKEDPDLNRGYGINVFSLDEENTDPDFRNDLRVFSAGALLVLLLACASLAGLMLIRTAARARNTAVMAALGASRWGLLAPILSESFILAIVAGICGLLLSYAGVHLVAVVKPSDIHAPERLAINLHAFVFAGCFSLLTVLVFGLILAWLAAHGNLSDALKSSPIGGAATRGRAITRSVFVSVQIAVALTLAIVATLLIRSFQHVLAIDPGFRAQQVLTARLSLPAQRYKNPEDRERFCRQLRERLQSLPGIEAAALIDNMPMYAIRLTSFEIEGRPTPEQNAAPTADYANVTPDFFRAMDVALRQGQLFTDQDAETNPPNVAIINETLARQSWPNQNPVGSHIRQILANRPPGPWQTVIGVVGDFRQFNPETPARPELLWPAKAFSEITVVLRTGTSNPGTLSSLLEQRVWEVDHDQPVSDIETLEQLVTDYNSQRKFNTFTLGAFAMFSILLMLVGVYGLISSFISSHIRDIGIRFALGGQRRQVCLSLLLPVLVPVLAGIALGLMMSFLAKRLIATVVFQISPLDPLTYILTPIALIAILLVTSVAATVRAARIDPASVLRQE